MVEKYKQTLVLTIACTGIVASIMIGCNEKKAEKSTTVPTEKPVFKKVPSVHSGVTFKNMVDENINNYFDYFAYVYNGGGVAIGDINNDGLADIYLTGNEVPNKLYLNEGNLKFKDISESAGVAGNGRWNNGVTMCDVNQDGLMDIYVCKGGWHQPEESRRNLLYINQGDLTFKEQAKEFGLDESGYSLHASFFDMDNDNDLDLYVTNHPDSFDLPLTEMVRQKKLSPTNSRDKLFINEGNQFKEIGLKAGIVNNFGYALSVVTADLNNDGYTDIYVANDFAEGDYMYINQKNGTFKEQIKKATNHISMYSMGTDVADINNDGLEDIMVSEMLPEDYKRSKVSMPSMDVEGFNEIVKSGMHKQYMHNALHLNQGNLFFSDVSQMAGVAKTEWSWSVLMADFDNDGQRDIFVANGYRRDVFDGDLKQKLADFVEANRSKYASPQEMFQKGFKEFINIYDPIKVRNYLFRNKGDLQFENVSGKWGFVESSYSNGAAVGDLDNDGDLDMVINNLEDESFVYENTSAERNNYLKVKLVGPATNQFGIGAKVTLYYDHGEIQYFENKTVRGYLSSNDPVVHFGLGKVTTVDSVHVLWNDGKINVIKPISANQMLQVPYSEAARNPKRNFSSPTLFNETATSLTSNFIHRENELNEFQDQILLPHTFSKNGPFISVADVDNNGEEDFFVGGAAGQAGSLYLQNNSKLSRKAVPAFERDKSYEDMGSVWLDADQDGDLDLYVVSGGSEFDENSNRYNDRLYINEGNTNFTSQVIAETKSSGSCAVAHDVDGDGDLDLFRGGQVVAHAYPKPPRNYLLINENGKFIDKTTTLAADLSEIGMVNSAVWVDLNNDKKAELVLAGEWMPITVLEFKQGKLENVTSHYGLTNTQGWWNKVIANDVDGDGDQDLISGNLGENYKFKASVDRPFQVYAKDFDGNGTNDIFLARYIQDSLLVPIRGRECSSQQMPVLAEKFPTYLSFAESDLSAILGTDIKNAMHYSARTFSSAILINDQGRFSARKLPVEAQLSTVNAIIVEDFDGDGVKDILLAGNKFDVEVETTPADASPGLFMKGLGGLNFKPMKSFESGFFVPYNVKDVQVIRSKDQLSVLVSVNNEALRVFTVSGSARTKKNLAMK
jgi:hypothetical protein